jgi:peptidyl-prolyl cis-trans isomerase B (cyclophilin B)
MQRKKGLNIPSRALLIPGIVLSFIMVMMAWAPVQAERRNTLVKLTTNMGEIVVELNEEKAPISSANFLAYVNDGFYDGTVFHRVIDGFMIQGGGMTEDLGMKKTKDPIQNEADNGLKNEAYTLAMARTQDPNSASSQFFINVKDNDFLNHTEKNLAGWGYAVFAKVVEGTDVVDKIKGVPTGKKGFYEDVPKEPVIIEKAEVIQ